MVKVADILPCPFCGSADIEIHQTNPESLWFGCGYCGAETSAADHVNKALEMWNQRAEEPQYD